MTLIFIVCVCVNPSWQKDFWAKGLYMRGTQEYVNVNLEAWLHKLLSMGSLVLIVNIQLCVSLSLGKVPVIHESCLTHHYRSCIQVEYHINWMKTCAWEHEPVIQSPPKESILLKRGRVLKNTGDPDQFQDVHQSLGAQYFFKFWPFWFSHRLTLKRWLVKVYTFFRSWVYLLISKPWLSI